MTSPARGTAKVGEESLTTRAKPYVVKCSLTELNVVNGGVKGAVAHGDYFF